MPDRERSDSRCCHPTDIAYVWHDFVDDNHYAVAELKDWLDSLHPFARNNELGRIDELFEAAAGGRIVDPGEDVTTKIKPVRHDPDLWELRHKALKNHLRFYHAEPPHDPTALVKLHRHIKTDDEDQQNQIDYASERYRSGDDWELM